MPARYYAHISRAATRDVIEIYQERDGHSPFCLGAYFMDEAAGIATAIMEAFAKNVHDDDRTFSAPSEPLP